MQAFLSSNPVLYVFVCLAVFVVTFLLGSIPWGLIISKVFYGIDIRKCGSGNIGTTNAMRSMGKAGGIAVFLLDFAKGILSGAIAFAVCCTLFSSSAFNGANFTNVMLGISFYGCVLGHIFSPWLKFRGGKGIAVAIGCLFVVFGVWGAVLELAIFAVLVLVTKYVSVGSIASAAACPFIAAYYFLYTSFSPLAWFFVSAGACFVLWAHRSNMARLRAGNERKIGSSKHGKHEGAK